MRIIIIIIIIFIFIMKLIKMQGCFFLFIFREKYQQFNNVNYTQHHEPTNLTNGLRRNTFKFGRGGWVKGKRRGESGEWGKGDWVNGGRGDWVNEGREIG